MNFITDIQNPNFKLKYDVCAQTLQDFHIRLEDLIEEKKTVSLPCKAFNTTFCEWVDIVEITESFVFFYGKHGLGSDNVWDFHFPKYIFKEK
jgi:hypothetical protein